MRFTSVIGFGLLSLVFATVSADEVEPLLQAPAGPYRGTVVDAASKRPLADAAVVLIWQRPDDQFPQRRLTAAVREAMTDGAGQFVLNAVSIEQRFSTRSFAPRIVIFKAGYTPYPKVRSLFPPGESAMQFVGAGAEAALMPVSDFEDRADAFNRFFEVLNSAHVPPNEIPQTWQAMTDELQRLMAAAPKPPRPAGRP
jgi:hypothetical protein